jgi:glycosyltransferase involved in cell wall biosynthesis
VDSGSSDRSVEIATSAGAQVVAHPFENYAAQRNWAQKNLPIRTEWVLHLDADERLTPELAGEIREALGVNGKASRDKIDGFLLRKRTFFMGRWIRHGGHLSFLSFATFSQRQRIL